MLTITHGAAGATNRPDALDAALRRAGRFDREIAVGIPSEAARASILRVLTRPLRLSGGFDFGEVAKRTPGFVGADLQVGNCHCVNESCFVYQISEPKAVSPSARPALSVQTSRWEVPFDHIVLFGSLTTFKSVTITSTKMYMGSQFNVQGNCP